MARNFIKQHFEKAYQRGWIPYFAKASLQYDFPLALLLAIASRETNMNNIMGDYRKSKHFPKGGYHGYGIMQVDIGTDPAWISSGRWKNVNEAIMHGTKILDSKRKELNRMWVGTRTLREFLWTLAASYNTGSGRAYPNFKQHGNPDKTTTGGDYGKDVLQRMTEFQELLTARGITAASYAMQGTSNLAALPQAPASVTSPDPASPPVGSVIQVGEHNEADTGAAPAPVQGGSALDPAISLSTTAPVKSGGLKSIIAAVTAPFIAVGVGFTDLITGARNSFQENPTALILSLAVLALIGVVYWKYQDRQTQLDRQREQNAHERDLANQRVLADPKQINVEVKPPVPAAQQPENQPTQPVTFRG